MHPAALAAPSEGGDTLIHPYTQAELQRLILDLSGIFDVVRAVEPVLAVEMPPQAGEAPGGCFHCHAVWNHRAERCVNCVSLRALQEGKRLTKYEAIGQDIFYVIAQPIEVDGNPQVLEMISKVEDQALLSAYGVNEFVNRITAYNAKLHTDYGTGLFNRAYYEEKLFLLLKKADLNKTDVAIAMMDVDGFDYVATHFGHQVADEAILAIGQLLTANVSRRRGDFVARYSPSSFVLVLDNIPRRLMRERMVELVQRVTSLRLMGYEDVRLNVAMGVFLLSDLRQASVQDVTQTLTRRVDIARAAGFNRIAFSDR